MTISSEITRIKTNIESAYVRLNEKGATIPEEKTSANLATCITSIPSGGTVNNQDKIIVENGTYTADEGYSGLGTVTVNVPSSPVTSANTYGKEMATEYLQNLVDSCYDVSCFSLIDIEQDSSNDKTDIALTGDWVYKAADFNEQLEELLWPSHDKVYAMLSQIQ